MQLALLVFLFFYYLVDIEMRNLTMLFSFSCSLVVVSLFFLHWKALVLVVVFGFVSQITNL